LETINASYLAQAELVTGADRTAGGKIAFQDFSFDVAALSSSNLGDDFPACEIDHLRAPRVDQLLSMLQRRA
jgi:hypothetical protein